MKLKSLVTLATCLIACSAQAQVTIPTANGDLKLRLVGRTNIDAGSYINEGRRNGVAINDTRLGVQATFNEQWQSKIEISYADKSIAFKDVWVGVALNENSSFKLGNFFMPYGSMVLGLAYKFIEDASADYAFCPSRKMGLTYNYVSNPLNFTVGLFSDGNVDQKGMNKGYNISAKVVWRPVLNEENNTILHLGFAPLFTASDNDITIRGILPNTIESNKERTLISNNLHGSINQWRIEGEMMLFVRKFLFETHFLATKVNMPGNENYKANSAFGQVSYLLLGEKQNYNKKTGLTSGASAKSLELLCRFDYINLRENGEQKDLTVGLNYFINKYLNVKFNYVFANVHNADNFNMLQARMQFSF